MGDIADIVGGGTPSTGNQSYWDGDIDWYAPAEIADQIYANSSQKKITGLGYENSSAKMLPPGTVLFTSRAGIGKTAILTRKGCTNQGFQSIVPHRGELDSYFIFSRTEELKRYGELVGAGSTFVEVSGKQMAVMELMMPPTMREQQTIGGFFQQLDHLITLHQRECISFTGRADRLILTANKKRTTSSWEQRKLSEMCGTFEYGLNAAAKEFDGKNKYIRITDIDDASREFLLSDLSSPAICLDGMSKYLLSSGDIVFARTGASVGKTYIYRENDGIVYFAGFLIRAKVNQDNDAEFVFQSTLSPSYEKYIRITSQRSGQPGVNAQEYGEYDLFAPSKEEQQRIGHFLRGIDNLITLHQRKFEKLTNVKKSMLEKMFPQNGSTYPEIRFKGFTDPWEQRKLGEMGQTYTGLSGKTKDDFGHGQARFVTYMNVFSNPISNPEMTEPIEIDPKQNEVEVGDVFFTTSSETPEEVGMSSILLEKRGKTYLNSFCFGFRPSEKIDSYYLAYMLRSESTRAKIILLAQGISRYNISKNKVMEIAVSLPSLDEQKMIGQYFSQLDNLITLHQRKGKAAVSGCFLNCSSLEKSSAQSRTLELFGQTSNQEIKYIIDGLSILGGKLRNFCVKLIILLSYTRINDIAKYHISRNTECVHNIN